jgi:hypothetical protein
LDEGLVIMDYAKPKRGEIGYKSLFWPMFLVGVGMLWLLSNLNIISWQNVAVVFRLWPLVLIAVGLDLLIGRQSPRIGAVIGVGTAVIALGLVIVGPALGLVSTPELKNDQFSEPLEDADSAEIFLKSGVANLTLNALDDSNQLIEADLTHLGDVSFSAQGESQKEIRIEEAGVDFNKNWNPFAWFGEGTEHWEVGLSDEVPLDLQIEAGVGDSMLDLSQLQLASLRVNSGVGEVELYLPEMEEAYRATIEGGVGDVFVTIPEETRIDLKVSTGPGGVSVQMGEDASGKLNITTGPGDSVIDIPDDAAVRIEATTGVGEIILPGNFQRISGGDDGPVGMSGVWQTAGFDEADADEQIIIHFEGGVGEFKVE